MTQGSKRSAVRGSGTAWRALLGLFIGPALALALFIPSVAAQYEKGEAPYGEAARKLEVVQQLFPDAADTSDYTGDPPVVDVFDADGALLGYAFETIEVSRSVGFSGQPYLIVVGLGTDGVLRGAVLVHHVEPIVHHGTPQTLFYEFIDQYRGIDVGNAVRVNADSAEGLIGLDGINTATISAMFMNDSIVQSARRVARVKGLFGAAQGPELDIERYEPWDWSTMTENGAIAHLHLTNAEVAAAYEDRGIKASFVEPLGPPDETFIDLYAGLATPASVGRNLMGESRYNRAMSRRGLDDHLLLIAGRGDYSYQGISFWRTDMFDRIQLVQGDLVHRFTRASYDSMAFLNDKSAPPLDEIAVFTVPGRVGFDPLKPWRLDLLVIRETTDGNFHYANFALDYTLPESLLMPVADEETASANAAAAQAEQPMWLQAWSDRSGQIAVLAVALALLTGILFFMDPLVKRRRLYNWIRIGFLSFTLVWIGWYAGAQFTIIHLISYGEALLNDPTWSFFLIDPLIFIIAAFTLVSLILWGRGIFCGWLCPFGALQELANKAARAVRVPQLNLSPNLNQRLWPIKYLILIGLIGLAVYSMDAAAVASEVEPFKTAITLKFVRAWPFVVYAVALLIAGLFVERFFCRFMCPLGGALAIGGRGRMLEWLKRRPQCGTECRICESSCPVKAIEPSGRINMNECFYCLDCQIDYYDDHRCPPLIARRKRKEGRARLRTTKEAPAAAAE